MVIFGKIYIVKLKRSSWCDVSSRLQSIIFGNGELRYNE